MSVLGILFFYLLSYHLKAPSLPSVPILSSYRDVLASWTSHCSVVDAVYAGCTYHPKSLGAVCDSFRLQRALLQSKVIILSRLTRDNDLQEGMHREPNSVFSRSDMVALIRS